MKLKSILLAIITVVVASCSAVKKTAHKESTQLSQAEKKGIDTSKTATTDSKTTQAKTTAAGSEVIKETARELTVTFMPVLQPESIRKEEHIIGPINSGITAKDYTDTTVAGTRIRTKGTGKVNLKPSGEIEIEGQIESLKYRNNDKNQKKDTLTTSEQSSQSVTTSTQQQGIDTTQKTTDFSHQEADRGRTRIGASTGIWIALGLATLVLGFFAWKFGWLKRRKDDDKNNNPLAKGSYQLPKQPDQKS